MLVLLFTILSLQTYADNLGDSNQFFNWAERHYPIYFSPAQQPTKSIDKYLYRYYSAQNIYLATSGNNVYYFAPDLSAELVALGQMTDYVTIPVVGEVGSSSDNLITPALAKSANLTKGLTVFGINLLATAETPNNKVLHAANVLAELIDSDEDGKADNPAVLKSLQSQSAYETMYNLQEGNAVEIEYDILRAVSKASTTLGAYETRVNYADGVNHDASIEEIFHLITQFGYSKVYPDVFEESNTSTSIMALAMDVARGGRVTVMPEGGWVYPASAWWFYADDTADYATMQTEYMYWAMTSNIGMHDSAAGLTKASSEWLPNTKEKLANQDPTIYNLINDPKYAFPTVLPNADYTVYKFKESDIKNF